MGRSENVHVRLSLEDRQTVKDAAEVLGITTSAYIRDLISGVSRAIVSNPERENVLTALAVTSSSIVQRLPDAKPEIKFVVDEETDEVVLED